MDRRHAVLAAAAPPELHAAARHRGSIHTLAVTRADRTDPGQTPFCGAARIIAELMTGYFDDLYDMEEPLIRFQIITNIKSEVYEEAARRGVEPDDLSISFDAVSYDEKSGRLLAAHFGKGSITASVAEEWITLAVPDHVKRGQTKTLISASSSHPAIQILHKQIEDIDEVVIKKAGISFKGGADFIHFECDDSSSDIKGGTVPEFPKEGNFANTDPDSIYC